MNGYIVAVWKLAEWIAVALIVLIAAVVVIGAIDERTQHESASTEQVATVAVAAPAEDPKDASFSRADDTSRLDQLKDDVAQLELRVQELEDDVNCFKDFASTDNPLDSMPSSLCPLR
jgi:hypothetical protein